MTHQLLLRPDQSRKRARSFLLIFFCMFLVWFMTVPAFAAVSQMSLEEVMTAYEGQLPDWDSLQSDCEVSEQELADGVLEPKTKAARYLATVFGSKADYLKWKEKVDKYVDFDTETGSVGPKPKDDGTISAGNEQNYNRTESAFDKAVSKSSIKDLTYDIFGLDDWNPNNKFTTAFMDGFKSAINQIFYIGSNVFMWLFLVQTMFDAIYLAIPITRGILDMSGEGDAASSYGGGGYGGYGGMGGQQKHKFKFKVVSNEAVAACKSEMGGAGGGGMGGYGGYGGGADHTEGGNKVWEYIKARSAVIILLAVFLVLTAAGMWPRVIGTFAEWATAALSTIF